ncbi:MAG: histidine kinase N-terminal 7TM domain-containing protein [Clostridia bacterium]|nr:histidine kinase N-terminal 7TM domain-containing protein [Clostridia bacterium]
MTNDKIINLTVLVVSLVTLLLVFYRIFKKGNQNNLYKYFRLLGVTLTIHVSGLLLQILFGNGNIPLVYFEYITYTGGVFTPVIFMVIALIYSKPNLDIKKTVYLYIIPIISLLVLWTNDFHHLFYQQYSVDMEHTIVGAYFYIYTLYSYGLIFTAIVTLIVSSIKKSGFFSIQTALIVIGGLIPITVNILGTLNIISITIYITPILFIVTSICFSIAIFRYKALNITPIAFKTVINTMSDAYVVISNDGTVVDSNNTFKNIFKKVFEFNNDDNLFYILKDKKMLDLVKLQAGIDKCRKYGDIVSDEYHIAYKKFEKYFQLDIHPIKEKNGKEYVGTLLLFKDITQHKLDMEELRKKQDIIVKQGQLVSIGELAGGVAHDINTPISAIKTGILMMNTMEGERTEEEKEILFRMDNCATKIINIVNSMRNQIRNLGGNTNVKFKISNVVNDIKIITYHEVKKNNSEVVIDMQDDLEIQGDPTKLGQVLTNLIVNAAQSYGTDKGGKIGVKVNKAPNNMAMISVTDYAGGIDDSIAPYIFKNILTTKGTHGTGLGLYLAYSVIKGEFNGDITFDTEKGVGTTFYITIPKA